MEIYYGQQSSRSIVTTIIRLAAAEYLSQK
jgi:hypothetical protein